MEMFAIYRQVNLLKDQEKAKQDFKNLDGDIKDCYNFQKILETMDY